jgi:hypothetical protein
MDTLDLLRLGALSPMTLCFALGVAATLLRSDLKFPEPVYTALSIYLLLAIGLKGGAALATAPFGDAIAPALAGIGLGIAIPFWAYAALVRLGGFASVDAAALAAHYGSVSAVTFIAALAYVDSLGMPAEGFMPAILALMEVPAIVIGLLLAREARAGGAWRTALHEVLAGRSILLLAGGLVIGFAAGPQGYKSVAPFFADPFQGALCLFLLELGMVAARRPLPRRLRHRCAADQRDGRRRRGMGHRPVDRRHGRAGHARRQRLLYRRAGGRSPCAARRQSGVLPDRGAGHHLPVQPAGRAAALCRPRPAHPGVTACPTRASSSS